MFDLGFGAVPTVDDVRGAGVALSRIGEASDDADRIDLIRALEELKCSAEAAQAVLTAAFDRSQREAEARAGVPAERQGRAVAAQVALARRESPHRGRQHVGLAVVLDELPAHQGRVPQWCGSPSGGRCCWRGRPPACRGRTGPRWTGGSPATPTSSRGWATARSWRGPARWPTSSTRSRSSSDGAAPRRDRRVSLRPAPDVMSQLSALLPVKDGVAVWAVLGREADRARAAGDQRSRGQIMADTLVRRVLSPGEGAPSVPLMINVVVPDSVLLGDDDGFGWVQHYGPVPGDLLREWIAANAEQGVDQWVRRLYASPTTGELVSMDSKSRRFEGALADYLRLRDRQCRTRYCDAPVRHLDHAEAHADGGPTSAANGQGLCEHCNYAKDALGWSAQAATRTPPHHRDRDPHGSPIPEHRTADDGCRARAADRAGWVTCSRPSPARAPASGCRSSCPGPGRSRGECLAANGRACSKSSRPRDPDDLGGVTRGELVDTPV